MIAHNAVVEDGDHILIFTTLKILKILLFVPFVPKNLSFVVPSTDYMQISCFWYDPGLTWHIYLLG